MLSFSELLVKKSCFSSVKSINFQKAVGFCKWRSSYAQEKVHLRNESTTNESR